MRFYILLHMTGTVNNGDVLFSAALGRHELSLVESLGRCKRAEHIGVSIRYAHCASAFLGEFVPESHP